MPSIPSVQPAPRPSYPHMLPLDTELWTRFLTEKKPQGCTVAYDVHIGTEPIFAPNFPDPWRRMIRYLSSKRIDLVMFWPTETLIVEVKPYAGASAIGQALTYTHLFHREFPKYPTPLPCIITDTLQPDIIHLVSLYHITLIELDAE